VRVSIAANMIGLGTIGALRGCGMHTQSFMTFCGQIFGGYCPGILYCVERCLCQPIVVRNGKGYWLKMGNEFEGGSTVASWRMNEDRRNDGEYVELDRHRSQYL
jgi:hypothetical protein